MSIPVHELEAEVLGLPPEERARLLERLIESFEPESRVRDAWIALSLTREAEIKSGKAALVPGSEAVARVRARIA
ncbi:MAG: addiction module protein [Accumulibacter sp.]|jgi:putative addiction module component (TIGR02574 family)|uniref:addiction module protein n=1 Tax=Accumulibacter sp. TaxID=2053492 RepID=UPI002FC37FA7